VKDAAPEADVVTTIASIWMTSPDIPDAPDIGEVMPADAQADVLRLFTAHGSPLYRFCRFTLGRADEAEDVVQDTFLKLLQHLHAGGNRSNLKSWLFTVAANACRDRLRGRFRWLPWRVELDTRVVEPSDEAPDLRLHRAAARSRPSSIATPRTVHPPPTAAQTAMNSRTPVPPKCLHAADQRLRTSGETYRRLNSKTTPLHSCDT